MDIIKTIHSLQKKPEPIRKKIMAISITIIMIIIVGGWLAVMGRTLDTPIKPAAPSEYTILSATPFSLLKENLQNLFK